MGQCQRCRYPIWLQARQRSTFNRLNKKANVALARNIAAEILLGEMLAAKCREAFQRSSIVPFGASSVGQALGTRVFNRRFTRPTCVFLDGDNAETPGCALLPGDDAPEQIVFKQLQSKGWTNIYTRIGRESSLVHDACTRAMTIPEHHDWVALAATELKCSGETLWQAMCAEWVLHCLTGEDAKRVCDAIGDTLS